MSMSMNGPAAEMVEFQGLPQFTIAYQPIVNVPARRVVAYEALCRGGHGTSYPQMVASMDRPTLQLFQRHIADDAIRRAVALGLAHRNASLTLNLQPDLHPDALNAEFIRVAAARHGLPHNRIVVELTEDHHLQLSDLRELLKRNKAAGFVSAVDDFGAGYSGLTHLTECRPDILKLDRALITDINDHLVKQKIVGAFVRVCKALRMVLVAEGIETLEECRTLRRLGITLMQGYFFSHPVIGALPRFEECVVAQSMKDLGRRSRQEDSQLRVYGWSSMHLTPPAEIAAPQRLAR
jgi:EAL domain-containing protein (putative c-di-GMP-specific phosphodiesterase class I)